MSAKDDNNVNDIITLKKPENSLPLIFDSPHSGLDMPEDFDFSCAKNDLMHTADRYIDDLFSDVPEYGGVLLAANFPRSYIDVNRAVDDIDPSLLKLPEDKDFKWPFKEGIKPTQRSAAGIGLIRRLIKPGVPIYTKPIGAAAILDRIKNYYIPYHQILSDLVEEAHYRYGKSWFINCHSMPPESAVPKRSIGFVQNRSAQVDICLGNRDGTTCSKDFMYVMREFFEDRGYSVSINDPFKGVELIARHGVPAIGRHAVQVEINQALYLKDGHKNTKKYNALKGDINALADHLSAYVQSELRSLAAD